MEQRPIKQNSKVKTYQILPQPTGLWLRRELYGHFYRYFCAPFKCYHDFDSVCQVDIDPRPPYGGRRPDPREPTPDNRPRLGIYGKPHLTPWQKGGSCVGRFFRPVEVGRPPTYCRWDVFRSLRKIYMIESITDWRCIHDSNKDKTPTLTSLKRLQGLQPPRPERKFDAYSSSEVARRTMGEEGRASPPVETLRRP